MYFCPTEQTSLSPKFGIIVKGRKTDTGTEGDVVFLLSPSVMSSHSDSAYTKSWHTLSIHCRHGYSTASATLPAAEPTGATQAAVGQCVRLTGALSNKRAGEWCHWKDGTEAEMCIQKQSVRDLLLTHQRQHKEGCHIRYPFDRNRLGRMSDVLLLFGAAANPLLVPIDQLTLDSSWLGAFLGGVWHRAGKWLKILQDWAGQSFSEALSSLHSTILDDKITQRK